MIRPLNQLLYGVVLLAAASSQEQVVVQGTQNAVNRPSSVQVFLTAASKNGSPSVLDQAELNVSVDKQPAQVNTLRSAKSDPLLFALLVDMSGSDASTADSIKKATLELFQKLSTDGNRGYLVVFNDSVAISKAPLQVSQVQAVLDAVRFHGGTAVYDAIEQTCNRTLSRSGNLDTPRRAILLISDGEDNASNVTHVKAEEAAEREGVAIFSLVIPSSLAGPKGKRFLQEISRKTGGLALIGKNLSDGVAPLLSAIENEWALTLVPTHSLDQHLHSLKIKTSQEAVDISAPAQVSAQ